MHPLQPDRSLSEEMFHHFETCYPNEGCGLLLASENKPEKPCRYRVCRNVQDEFHALDPGTHPRTARNGYAISPGELMAVDRELRQHKEVIFAICHSHPDADVYFSQEDHERAVIDGSPLYPDSVQIVVSVIRGKAMRHGVFQWAPDEEVFQCVLIAPCDQSLPPGSASM